MTEVRIGDQTIRYDRDATAAVYGTVEHGDTERCGRIFCKNFAVQRDLVYPPSLRALREQMGIDPNKKGEAFEYDLITGCQRSEPSGFANLVKGVFGMFRNPTAHEARVFLGDS